MTIIATFIKVLNLIGLLWSTKETLNRKGNSGKCKKLSWKNQGDCHEVRQIQT